MTNMIQEIKSQIAVMIDRAMEKAVSDGVIPCKFEGEILVEKPREKSHGDYATNVAMQMAKAAKKNPRALAQDLLDRFDFSGTYVASAEIAGPGFLNFRLDPVWRADALRLIAKEGPRYGRQDYGKGEKVMVEYISANPTGPMHMGNARGGALGDSLANILSWAGYDCYKEFYLNNAGAQIEKLGKSLDARYIQLIKGEDAIAFPEDGYQGKDIIRHMKDFIAQYGTEHINLPEQERKKIFTAYAMEKNINKIKTDLQAYGIVYDKWFPEMDLYDSGEVEKTIEALKQSGYTYEKDDALWFKTSAFRGEPYMPKLRDDEEMKDDVLVRSNGIPTYFAVDIAYHRNKFVERGFSKVINVWGADHHGHIARMKSAMQALGINPDALTVIVIQLVRLMEDGKVIRMSKRTGELVTLGELLEDIGKDAARFFFNLRQADSHFDFDLNLATSQSNENPVYYVQYAHARICSILKVLAQENIQLKPMEEQTLDNLVQEEEINLITRLAAFPEEILLAATSYDPSRMTHYAMDLASDFHSFYNACRIKGEEDALLQARLLLVHSVKQVLESTLEILGVSAPEKM